jgi:uncharacterized protein
MGEQVIDNPTTHRYELLVDGVIAGHADYRIHPDAMHLIHTEVDPAFGGRGLGGVLARGVLDDVRARGLAIVPLCPFMASFIRKHREYADLIAPAHRAEFDAHPPA